VRDPPRAGFTNLRRVPLIEVLEQSAAPELVTTLPADRSLLCWVRRRWVPLLMAATVVAATMAYSLLWGPLVEHGSFWIVPGDIWGTLRSAQFVAWGDIGDVYGHGSGLVTLPGISLLLAPVGFVISHLNLSISFPYGLPHPTGWLILGPYEAAIGSIVLLPLDALAEQIGLDRRARLVASIAGAILLWPVVGIWGHPEDALGMALVLEALLAVMDQKWRRAGWLIGLALAVQPLVVLVVPCLVALVPRRGWPKLVVRTLAPAVILLAIPLWQSWRVTTQALLQQPNFPRIDHATPWLFLAPVLSKSHPAVIKRFFLTTSPQGVRNFTALSLHTVSGPVVAAGPTRMIAVGLSIVIGLYVFRRRPSPDQLLWFCCLALSLRCVFEAVMDPYYLWPPLALAFVLVVRSISRLVVATAATAAATWWSYRHLGPWEWWAPVVALLAVTVVSAAPQVSGVSTLFKRAQRGCATADVDAAVAPISLKT
jgi:hypothetical protein